MNERINNLRKTFKFEKDVLITGKANIFYFSGFTSEDAMLLITPDEAYIFTDSRYFVQAKEQVPDFELIRADVGIKNLLKHAKSGEVVIEDECMTISRFNRLKEEAPSICFQSGSEIISHIRAVKSPEEIKKIAEAEKLGDEAFSYILDFIKPGMKEIEIALALEFYFKKNGASALSFETIAASGVRGAMPHGAASEKVIDEGELLTLDFGCVLDGYCSDMTRTISIGTPSGKASEIYNVVLAAQEKALAGIKTGMLCADADRLARDVIKDAGYGEFFGHSLGHSVGIEIHELPSLSPKSKDTLRAGNVVTVEPGIYIPDFGGVRIEDVVAVTENGCENLTGSKKELIII